MNFVRTARYPVLLFSFPPRSFARPTSISLACGTTLSLGKNGLRAFWLAGRGTALGYHIKRSIITGSVALRWRYGFGGGLQFTFL